MYGRYIRVTPNVNGVYGHASMRLGILLRDDVLNRAMTSRRTFLMLRMEFM